MRIAIGVEYNGKAYAGWQRQADRASIQESVELALSTVADKPIQVSCAGRTDAGVHALQQVAHFDTTVERSERAWVLGGNCHLRPDIRLLWARPVAAHFDARRSALARHYRYLILNRPVRAALQHDQLSWCLQPLQERRMQLAAQALIGEHDFSAYRGSGCQSHSTMRRMDRLEVQRLGDIIRIDLVANAFLLHMVRNIVGVLCAIGSGDAEPQWAFEVLQSKDRRQGGMTAAADGLCLVRVFYPEEFALPKPTDSFAVLATA